MTDFSTLAASVDGPVLTPDQDGYAAEVTGQNLAISHHPDVVVGVTSAADTVAAVQFAREHGLAVHIENTGHAAHEPIQGGLLISLRRLSSVRIDPDARTATFGGGTRWAPIVAAAGEHGLAAITGSSPTVGAVGFLLGGGLGPIARSHGFSSDYLRSLTLVTGLGELVTASETENPDLFWALRGGKGGFGVVVEATVTLVELKSIYGGALFYDLEHGAALLSGWIDWTRTAPDDVTTSFAILRIPDIEQVPPPLRGRQLVSIRFGYPGPIEQGAAHAAPLRALAPVYLDMLGELPTTQMGMIHSDPPDPAPGFIRGTALTGLDDAFVSAYLGVFGAGARIPAVMVELRHEGGRVRADVAAGSAAGQRGVEWLFTFVGAPDPNLFPVVLPGVYAGVEAALAPWVAPITTVNWVMDPAVAADFDRAWDDEPATGSTDPRRGRPGSRLPVRSGALTRPVSGSRCAGIVMRGPWRSYPIPLASMSRTTRWRWPRHGSSSSSIPSSSTR